MTNFRNIKLEEIPDIGLDAAHSKYRLKKITKEEFFAICFKRMAPKLLRYVLYLVSDVDAAEDLCADNWVSFLESVDYLPEEIKVESYLYAFFRRRILEYVHKKRKKLPEMSLFQADNLQESPGSSTKYNVLISELNKIISSVLSPAQGELLALRYQQKLPLAAIAKLQMASPDSIRKELSDIDKKVRNAMQELGYASIIQEF